MPKPATTYTPSGADPALAVDSAEVNEIAERLIGGASGAPVELQPAIDRYLLDKSTAETGVRILALISELATLAAVARIGTVCTACRPGGSHG